MVIKEVELDESILSTLIAFSENWEKENSCYGYRKNTLKDIEGNRIFVAMDKETIVGYLFGHKEIAEKNTAIYKKNEEYFEIEELYVEPEYRNQGIGTRLFRYVEDNLRNEVNLLLLATATKNYRAILHFYIEELDMSFWSAALFKRINGDER